MITIQDFAIFLSTNEVLFRALMILLEIIVIFIIYNKYNKYHKSHRNVKPLEFVLNLFFADTVNPFPGYTDFFWIPVFSLFYGLKSFTDITVGQLIMYEIITAIIGFIGFLFVFQLYGRRLIFNKRRK